MRNEFTPQDFFKLANQAATHEAELKIKLAKAGIAEKSTRDQPAKDQMSSTNRP